MSSRPPNVSAPCEVTVYKAEGLGHCPEVADVTIHIAGSIPPSSSLEQSRALYRVQAQRLRDALYHLPQGTKHQLLILLLQDAESLYRGT